MTAPDFTIADVLTWARTKPANERYDTGDAQVCALGQFGAATGRHYLGHCYDPSKELGFPDLNDALGFNGGGKLTFGALAKRLEAILPAEPLSDTWTKADAYIVDAEQVSA